MIPAGGVDVSRFMTVVKALAAPRYPDDVL